MNTEIALNLHTDRWGDDDLFDNPRIDAIVYPSPSGGYGVTLELLGHLELRIRTDRPTEVVGLLREMADALEHADTERLHAELEAMREQEDAQEYGGQFGDVDPYDRRIAYAEYERDHRDNDRPEPDPFIEQQV